MGISVQGGGDQIIVDIFFFFRLVCDVYRGEVFGFGFNNQELIFEGIDRDLVEWYDFFNVRFRGGQGVFSVVA